LTNPRQLIIGLCIATLSIFLTFRNISANEILAAFQQAEYIYLFPITLLLLLGYVIRVFRWCALVNHIKPVSIGQLFPPMMIGFLGNMLPMRAGEIFRAYLLKKKISIPFAGSLATIIMERMFDIIMLNIVFTWVLVVHPHLFNSNTTWFGYTLSDIAFNFGCLSGASLCFLLTTIYFMIYKANALVDISKKLTSIFPVTWRNKFIHLLKSFTQGLTVINDWRALFKAGLYSLLDWTCMITSSYYMYLAFNLNNKSIESLLLLAVIVPIFMTLLPTPGFVGSVQAGVFVALHTIMGEDPAVVAAYGMVAWAWGLIIQILMGFYFLFRENISWRTLLKIEKEGDW
jgi:glycosyltransferase 2 family protein